MNQLPKYIHYDVANRCFSFTVQVNGKRLHKSGFCTKRDCITEYNSIAREHGLPVHPVPRDEREWLIAFLEDHHVCGQATPFKDFYAEFDKVAREKAGERHPFTKRVTIRLIRETHFPIAKRGGQMCIGNLAFQGQSTPYELVLDEQGRFVSSEIIVAVAAQAAGPFEEQQVSTIRNNIKMKHGLSLSDDTIRRVLQNYHFDILDSDTVCMRNGD